MSDRIRIASRARLAAMILSSMLGFTAVTATAQLAWNPPCRQATVINNTSCTAQFTPWTVPAWPGPPILVPACGSVVVLTPPPGGLPPLTINGVFSQAGNPVPVILGGPPPPVMTPCATMNPVPGVPNAWIRGITLGPAPGCCFDIYFYRNSDPRYPCTIILYPGMPPCVP